MLQNDAHGFGLTTENGAKRRVTVEVGMRGAQPSAYRVGIVEEFTQNFSERMIGLNAADKTVASAAACSASRLNPNPSHKRGTGTPKAAAMPRTSK